MWTTRFTQSEEEEKGQLVLASSLEQHIEGRSVKRRILYTQISTAWQSKQELDIYRSPGW